MNEVVEAFHWIDWVVVAAYMIGITILGERLAGKQNTIKDFFLGGKSLPWWAVSGSMIATEISALTFIGVPAGLYALQGDWTYLQWGIGSIIARFAVAYWLVPLYYEKQIYSPYDFMGNRLGEGARRLVTALFSVGSVLGASVRVVVTALILKTVTGMDGMLCIAIIGAIAVLWTFLGGMQTVIWTDAIQFCLFAAGGLLAFGWLYFTLGFGEVFELNQVTTAEGEKINKMNMLDLTTPFQDKALAYTLWVGIFAMPFQNFAAFGVDQLNTQRMFCCGSIKDARKAMCWSSISILITLLMLAVGSGLFAWYLKNPPSEGVLAGFKEDKNFVFPAWIVTVLPIGISGTILAAAFAAAISSLDSVLAALSQTSLSIIFGRDKLEDESQSKKRVAQSRMAVCIWGVVLTIVSLVLWGVYTRDQNSDLIALAFGVLTYTFGPLLGVLLAAIFLRSKTAFPGLLIGSVFSFLLAVYMRPDVESALRGIGVEGFADWLKSIRINIVSVWLYPVSALLTFIGGLLSYCILPKERVDAGRSS